MSALPNRCPSGARSCLPLELAQRGDQAALEALERYERPLAKLRPEDRAVIVARVELGYTNPEIAALLNKPSASAARMALERALVHS